MTTLLTHGFSVQELVHGSSQTNHIMPQDEIVTQNIYICDYSDTHTPWAAACKSF